MKKISQFLAVLAVIGAFGASFPFPAMAQDVAEASGSTACIFEPLIAELENVRQNPLPDYIEQIRAELKIRKEILRSVIDCSSEGAQAIRVKLEALPLEETGGQELRDHFVRQLVWAEQYFAGKRANVDNLGIRGSRELAAELLAWRSSNYAPLAAGSLNFIVWAQNQNLFRAARVRSGDIQKTVDRLQLGENSDIAALYAETLNKLAAAESANHEALAALWRFDASPDDTLVLLKNSLVLLAETYESFFTLSEAVQGIVPH